MTMRRGRCNNLGLCENATRQRTIEVPDNEAFVCPKCGTELVAVAERGSTRKASSAILPAVAITVAVAAIGYKAWDMFGRHAARPPAQVAMTTAPIPAPAPPPEPAPAEPAPAPAAPAPTAPGQAAPADQAAGTPPAPPAAVAAASPPPPAVSPPLGVVVPPPPAAAPPVEPAPAPLASAAPDVSAEPPTPAAPAAVTPAPAADPAERVHAFLGNAARVPVTFTFKSGSVSLTGRDSHEVERLVGYLGQHHATGERVLLAGFTDNQGDAASNDAVAQKRVVAVAAALTQAGFKPGHVASFGSELPVADNTTQAGRDRNRRVEVYLAP